MTLLLPLLTTTATSAPPPTPARCEAFLADSVSVMAAIDEPLLRRVAGEQGYDLGAAVAVKADDLRQIARESQLPVPAPGASVDTLIWNGATPDDAFVVSITLETLETTPEASDPVCTYTKGLEERFVAGAGAVLVGVAVTRVKRRWTFDAAASASFLDTVLEAAMARTSGSSTTPSAPVQ